MSIPNGLNPTLMAINLGGGTAYITGGIATGTTAITADVKTKAGAVGNGSVYISQNGAGEVWILVSGTWTQLTVN